MMLTADEQQALLAEFEQPQQSVAGESLVNAIMGVESSFNPNAVSPKGATGLMQVMPSTAVEIAKELGVSQYDLKNPETSKQFGTHYINKMLGQFGGDERLALAAYNAGPGRVSGLLKQTGGNSFDDIQSLLPAETQAYVPKVLARKQPQQQVTTPSTSSQPLALNDEETAALLAEFEPPQAAQQPQPELQKSGQYWLAPAEQVLKGATFGFGDEIVAGLGAGAIGAANMLGITDETAGDAYDRILESGRADQKAFEAENPGTSFGLQVLGSLPASGKLALTGGKTLAQQVMRGTATGAGGAAVAAAGSGEGAQDRWNKATEAAIVGAPLGAAAPVVARGVTSVVTKPGGVVDSAIDKLAQSKLIRSDTGAIGSNIDDVAAATTRAVQKAPTPGEAYVLETLDYVSPDELNAATQKLQQASERGTPALLPDVLGRKAQGKLEYLATSPTSRDVVGDALETRTRGQSERLGSAFDKVAPSGDVYESGKSASQVAEKLIQAKYKERSRLTKPLYDTIRESVPELESEGLSKLMKSTALKDAIAKARTPGYSLEELPDNSFDVLQAAKEFLYDQQGTLFRNGQKREASYIGKIREQLTEEMDSIIKERTGGDSSPYKAARKLFQQQSEELADLEGGPLSILNSLKEGNYQQASSKVFSQPPSQIGKLKELFRDDEEAWSSLLRSRLDEVVDKTGDTHDLTKRLFQNPGDRKRWKAALSPERYEELEAVLELERAMAETNRWGAVGSATAGRMQEGQKAGRLLKLFARSLSSPASSFGDALTYVFDKFDYGGAAKREAAEILTSPERTLELLQNWGPRYVEKVNRYNQRVSSAGSLGIGAENATATSLFGNE